MKIYKSVKYVILSLCLLSLYGCTDDSASPSDGSELNDVLIPLKVGNYWIYNCGTKVSGAGQIQFELDTLSVVAESDLGYMIQSRLEFIMPNGFYSNKSDGLYREDRLQFKYPSEIGEPAGEMLLFNLKDTNGNSPYGYLSKDDHKFVLSQSGNTTDTLTNCYYYFLLSFYQNDSTQTTGYTIFKPGIGIVQSDWVDIMQTDNRSMYNYFGTLKDYHLE